MQQSGQQQQSGSSFTTGAWQALPKVFATGGGVVVKLSTTIGEVVLGVQGMAIQSGIQAGTSINAIGTPIALTSIEAIPNNTGFAVPMQPMAPMQPMTPMAPMQMGNMQMNLKPMTLQMGNMAMTMGNEATVAATSASSISEQIPPERVAGRAKFCSQCGNAVKPGDRFCSNCGHSLQSA